MRSLVTMSCFAMRLRRGADGADQVQTHRMVRDSLSPEKVDAVPACAMLLRRLGFKAFAHGWLEALVKACLGRTLATGTACR